MRGPGVRRSAFLSSKFFESRIPNPESRVPDPESRIPSPESRVPSPGSRFDRQLRADDRAQPSLLRGLMKTWCAVDSIGIEQCERWITQRCRTLDERFG